MLFLHGLCDVAPEPRGAPAAVRVAQGPNAVPDRPGEGRIDRMAGGPEHFESIGPGIVRLDSWGEVEATRALPLGKGPSVSSHGDGDRPCHHRDGAIGIVAAGGFFRRFLKHRKQRPLVRRGFCDISEGLHAVPCVGTSASSFQSLTDIAAS